MNEKHLRIGNLVYGIYEDENGKQKQNIVSIMALDSTSSLGDGWWAIAERIEGEETEEYEDFKPIHLTWEWLFRFMFEEYHSNPRLETFYVLKNGYYPFQVYAERDFRIYYSPNVRLEYVHQLQNLYFALTGEELEIKT